MTANGNRSVPGFARYITILFAVMAFIIGSTWIYTTRYPLYFQESGYTVWSSKYEFIHSCDFGSTVLLGDSRAQSAFMPDLLEQKATNLSFGAATPIELYITATHVFECRNVPKRMFVSLASVEFLLIQKFLWENGARYGFFSFADLRGIAAAEKAIGDSAVNDTATRDGANGLMRDALYGFHFPSIYFNSLVQGRVFRRYRQNARLLATARQARGFLAFASQGTGALPGREVGHPEFDPLPIQDYFFDRLLSMAEQRGVALDFVAAPISATTSAEMAPAFRDGFERYLRRYEARYPNFHVVSPLFYTVPTEMFADTDHLNIAGARFFTGRLASCLADLQARTIGIDQTWNCTSLRSPTATSSNAGPSRREDR